MKCLRLHLVGRDKFHGVSPVVLKPYLRHYDIVQQQQHYKLFPDIRPRIDEDGSYQYISDKTHLRQGKTFLTVVIKILLKLSRSLLLL
jgi:hypothetical protein